MKKVILLTAILSGSVLLSGCGALGGPQSQQPVSQSTSASSSSSIGDLIGSVLGQFTQTTNQSTIIGTWTYAEPAVQFESGNVLAQAGGAVAGKQVVEKIEPYYKKVGITPGMCSITINQDKSCTYTIGGQTYSGTYTFDNSKKTMTIKGTLLTFPTAYVSVSGNQLSLTFDSSKILSLFQKMAANSQDASISTIGSISKTFDGMKTGFLFKKR